MCLHVCLNRKTFSQNAQKNRSSKAVVPRLTLVSRFTPYVLRFLRAMRERC